MAKPTYDAEAAKRYRQARNAERASLIEKASQLGKLEEIKQIVDQHVDELLHSTTLRVWRYEPRLKEKPHLAVEYSDGSTSVLCGTVVPERSPSKHIALLQRNECQKCSREADTIFKRTKKTSTQQC
jgi:hypothetical protein